MLLRISFADAQVVCDFHGPILRGLTLTSANIGSWTNCEIINANITLGCGIPESLIRFPVLTTITGSLTLANDYQNRACNCDLPGITANAFPMLQEIGGNLRIRSMCSLTTLEGFGALRMIGKDLSIINNTQLTDVEGFQSLNSVRRLTLSMNDQLTDLRGFRNLSYVEERLVRTIVLCELLSFHVLP